MIKHILKNHMILQQEAHRPHHSPEEEFINIFKIILLFSYYLPLEKDMAAHLNKRPTGLNGHLSIRDFTLTSCRKGSYLYINSPIKE